MALAKGLVHKKMLSNYLLNKSLDGSINPQCPITPTYLESVEASVENRKFVKNFL